MQLKRQNQGGKKGERSTDVISLKVKNKNFCYSLITEKQTNSDENIRKRYLENRGQRFNTLNL